MERGDLRDGAVFLCIGLVMAGIQIPFAEYFLVPFFGEGFSALQIPEQAMIYSSIIEAVLGILLWILIAENIRWGEQLRTLKESKGYIAASGALLVAGAASGLFFGEALWFISQPLIDGLTAFAEYASKLTLSHFIVFIFGNNIRVAVTAGISMALIPVVGLLFSAVSALLNGLVLGTISEATGISFAHLLIGTMPHGILEIPAFVLSIAVGMRVNVSIIQGLLDFISPLEGGSRMEGLGAGLKSAIATARLFYLIVPMFLTAAIIESLISIWLINSL